MEHELILDCRDVTKRYGKLTALDAVTLGLKAGRVAGLLGPNGSGKTTLIKLICGLLQAESGQIRIAGNAPGRESKALLSYLPDRMCLDPWMRLRDILTFYAAFYADFRVELAESLLAALGLDLNKRLKTLSKGNQEKTQLVMVMARKARLYLLDEPIGGVDPAARDYIIQTIISNHSADAAALISTHLIQDVEPVLDDIIFIKEGRVLLHGAADDIRRERGVSIDALFREQFKC